MGTDTYLGFQRYSWFQGNPGFQGYPGYGEVPGYNAFGSNARSVNEMKYVLFNHTSNFTSILKHYSNRLIKRIQ